MSNATPEAVEAALERASTLLAMSDLSCVHPDITLSANDLRTLLASHAALTARAEAAEAWRKRVFELEAALTPFVASANRAEAMLRADSYRSDITPGRYTVVEDYRKAHAALRAPRHPPQAPVKAGGES